MKAIINSIGDFDTVYIRNDLLDEFPFPLVPGEEDAALLYRNALFDGPGRASGFRERPFRRP